MKALTPSEVRMLLPVPSPAALLFLQERPLQLPDFRAYFLGSLANNWGQLPLLAAYMEQIHNCSLAGPVPLPSSHLLPPPKEQELEGGGAAWSRAAR